MQWTSTLLFRVMTRSSNGKPQGAAAGGGGELAAGRRCCQSLQLSHSPAARHAAAQRPAGINWNA